MQVRCPSCGAQMSLDVIVDDGAAAQALHAALDMSAIGALVIRYLAMFRPAKNKLTWPRVAALLGELLPLIKQERLERDGRVHEAPMYAWSAASPDRRRTRRVLRIPAQPRHAQPVNRSPAAESAAAGTARAAASQHLIFNLESTMTTKNAVTLNVPDGYRVGAKGCLIPESMIKPIDRTRDELVKEIARQARIVSDGLRSFKASVFSDIDAFVELSAEEYGVKLGGKKGNLTLYSFDGKYKVQVSTSEHMVFDERLQAAKHLIDECITDWSLGSRDEIKVLVQAAFQTDKEGKINTGRVLALRRLDIRSAKWQTAMKAIGESLQVVGSKAYVRFYERIDGTEQYQTISLDLAAV